MGFLEKPNPENPKELLDKHGSACDAHEESWVPIHVLEELQSSESLLRMASKVGHMGAWRIELPSLTVHWTEEVRAIHEVTEDFQPLADNLISFYLPEEHPRVEVVFGNCIHNGIPFDEKFRFRTAKGRELVVRVIGEAVRNPAGAIIMIQGAIQDISEEERLRNDADALAKRLARTLANMTDGFVMLDREWRFTFFNAAAEKQLSRKPSELLGNTLWDMFPLVEGTSFGNAYRRAMEEQIPITLEDYYAPLDRWVEVRIYPSEDGLAIYSQNVTDKHRNREALVRSEEKSRKTAEDLANVMNSSLDMICSFDAQGRFLQVSSACEFILGYRSEDLIGRRFEEFIMEDDLERSLKELMRLQQGGRPKPFENRYPRSEGDVVWIQWTARWSPKDQTFFCVARDVTEKRELEQQLLRAQRVECIGSLAGGIAHDLNNLLSPILMAVDLLKTHTRDADSVDLLEFIKASARRGADMVSQVVSFARGMDKQRVIVDLSPLFRELAKFVKDTFPWSIHCHCEIEEDLWDVEADPTQIHQVLINLCLNSRDAMPNGGQLTLSVANAIVDDEYASMNLGAEAGPYLRILVEDTGEGMSAQILEKIFDPFYTTKATGKGTGLGLSVALKIIRDHGGFISVTSAPGGGSRFLIYLPATPHSATTTKPPYPRTTEKSTDDLILLVDDEVIIRHLARQILERQGYQVLEAGDGEEALEVLEHHPGVGIVLADMSMPGMDGESLIRHLTESAAPIRIIATSGVMDRGKFRNVRFNRFLSKPFSSGELLQAVGEMTATKLSK